MRNKHLFWIVFATSFSLSIDFLSAKNVVICQIVEHTALNQIREGIINELSGENISWSHENAQGNPTIASQIGQKVAGEEFDLIIALATPMAQAIASTNTNSPILFGAVSDPVSAKLVKSMSKPGKNISGITDNVPIKAVFGLINVLLPRPKTLGIIYNSGEANSAVQAERIKSYAQDQGIEVVEATVSKSSDVSAATKQLITQVDAILLPTDNTVISALEAITKIALQHKVPVIGSDVDIVKRGAVAAIGVNWTAQGHQLGKMAKKVLDGTTPETMPVQPPAKLYVHINVGTAKKIGLAISEDLQMKADQVFEE